MTGKTIQLIVKCTEVLKLIITGVHNTHTQKKQYPKFQAIFFSPEKVNNSQKR